MDSMDGHQRAVGRRIAELREAKGLSQPQLAFNAGISQPSLWAIEHGKTVEVTARTLIALCRALDTTWEYIWDGAEVGQDDAQKEAELVAIYRALSAPGKMAVLQSAHAVRAALPAIASPGLGQTVLLSSTKAIRRPAGKRSADK